MFRGSQTCLQGVDNEEVIQNNFIPIDAEAIMRTPMSPSNSDMWAWEPEKHGVYSVKSASKLLEADRVRLNIGEASSLGDVVWRHIWKLEVPPKVRVFWWRVLHDFLPVKQVLHRRHVEPLANCEVYGAEKESIKHVLLECTISKLFWSYAKKLACLKIPDVHPDTWARDILLADLWPARERAMIIVGMYSLWTL
jgi:hypothetical protein